MFGWGYVREHCIALFKKEKETELYQIYIARTLMNISKNVALNVGGEYINVDYFDLINGTHDKTYEKGKISENIKSKFR